jgi:ribonuclease HII
MQVHSFEKEFLEKYDFIISIDEAGRGPWAGPVTVGAVVLDKHLLEQIVLLEKLNDSKKISSKNRNILETQIKEIVANYHISDISVETIDSVNILEATKLGVLECLEKIVETQITRIFEGANYTNTQQLKIGILLDGKFNNLESLINQLAIFQNVLYELRTVIDGDALCPSIAAASILAKEHRDRLMLDLHKKYPEYGFDKHKGYGTQLHQERLKIFGPSEIHRKSFAPIKSFF